MSTIFRVLLDICIPSKYRTRDYLVYTVCGRLGPACCCCCCFKLIPISEFSMILLCIFFVSRGRDVSYIVRKRFILFLLTIPVRSVQAGFSEALWRGNALPPFVSFFGSSQWVVSWHHVLALEALFHQDGIFSKCSLKKEKHFWARFYEYIEVMFFLLFDQCFHCSAFKG